jgi:hypothetical protein
LLELSRVYKIPANKRIFAPQLFLGFRKFTRVAAQVWKPGHG